MIVCKGSPSVVRFILSIHLCTSNSFLSNSLVKYQVSKASVRNYRIQCLYILIAIVNGGLLYVILLFAKGAPLVLVQHCRGIVMPWFVRGYSRFTRIVSPKENTLMAHLSLQCAVNGCINSSLRKAQHHIPFKRYRDTVLTCCSGRCFRGPYKKIGSGQDFFLVIMSERFLIMMLCLSKCFHPFPIVCNFLFEG